MLLIVVRTCAMPINLHFKLSWKLNNVLGTFLCQIDNFTKRENILSAVEEALQLLCDVISGAHYFH